MQELTEILERQTNVVGSTFFYVVSPEDDEDESPSPTNLEHLGSNRNRQYLAFSEFFTKLAPSCMQNW